MAFMDLICRFAALDGEISAQEGIVFSEIFRALHPRKGAVLTAEFAAELLRSHLQRNPTILERPIKKDFLLQAAEAVDAAEGSSHASELGKVMLDVATLVALSDGPLAEWERNELESLAILVGFKGDTPIRPITERSPVPTHADEHAELDRLVAEDAVKREGRAKAALTAVLKQAGCSEKQILEVLKTIDEPETNSDH